MASSVPSLWERKEERFSFLVPLAADGQTCGRMAISARESESSHSSPARSRLCCSGRPGRPRGCSGAGPAGWSWRSRSRSGPRSVPWSPPSWRKHTHSGVRGQASRGGTGVNRLTITRVYKHRPLDPRRRTLTRLIRLLTQKMGRPFKKPSGAQCPGRGEGDCDSQERNEWRFKRFP